MFLITILFNRPELKSHNYTQLSGPGIVSVIMWSLLIVAKDEYEGSLCLERVLPKVLTCGTNISGDGATSVCPCRSELSQLNLDSNSLHILTKLTNGGPLCRPQSSVGVKRASGRGSAPPEAGGVTMSAPAQGTRLKSSWSCKRVDWGVGDKTKTK